MFRVFVKNVILRRYASIIAGISLVIGLVLGLGASVLATTIGSDVSVSGALTTSGTSAVSGAATFSSTVGVSGATTLSSTLAVTGASTFSSTVGISSTTPAGDLSIEGAGNLMLGGRSTGTSTLTIDASSTPSTTSRGIGGCINIRGASDGAMYRMYIVTGGTLTQTASTSLRVEAGACR